MANYHEDIVNIELESGNIHRSFLHHSIGAGDDRANRFGVRVFRNGVPENVSGSCFGLFIRADGATVAINNGVVSGNVAYVTLPDTCYAVEGQFCLTIKVSTENNTITLRIVDGVVSRTSTNTAVDPGTIIPSVEDLIEAIEEAAALIPADYSAMSDMVMKRTVYFANLSSAARNALTYNYNPSTNVYSVTVNKNFTAVGYNADSSIIRIGYNPQDASIDYPMPSSFSSNDDSTGFSFICFDLDDHTSSTWQIVKWYTFINDTSLVAIACVYHDHAYFFNDAIKTIFTNSIKNVEFLNYEAYLITGISQYWNLISNATALIYGTANFIPSEYKVVFTNPVFAPGQDVGSFIDKRGQTFEVDWSDQPNPSYERCIYYDLQTGGFVATYSGNLTSDEKFEQRIKKNLLALVCIVFQGTFVYTCGSCVPGKWYINGNDLYGGASDEYPPDLINAFQKVGVVGDSLSVGYMYNKDTGTATSRMLKYSWVKDVMKSTGVPWLNLGTSGQNVLTWCTNSTYGKVQAEASGNKCQAYIIGLGENDQSDSARGIPLGQPSDIVDNYQTVATTYYGGYARIIQILKHLNPDCKIFCLTNPRTGGNARAAYNVAVRYIAGTYYTPSDNVFLVDLANNDGMEFNGNSFLPVDSATITGGHYSAVGYARIASILEIALTKTMEANQEKFIDIAYIDYDTGDPTANTMTE